MVLPNDFDDGVEVMDCGHERIELVVSEDRVYCRACEREHEDAVATNVRWLRARGFGAGGLR